MMYEQGGDGGECKGHIWQLTCQGPGDVRGLGKWIQT